MITQVTLIAALFAFFIGGIAKGALGIGLSMLSIPVMSTFLPIRDAVAISFFPMVATNFWQMIRSEHLLEAFRRFWLLLVIMIASTWAGTLALVHFSTASISVLLGVVVLLFATYSLLRPAFVVTRQYEPIASVGAGAVGGFFGGLALISGPPIIMLLLALELEKEEFIGAMGLLYFVGLVPGGLLLIHYGVINTSHIVPGLLSFIPVFAGLALGAWIRRRINQVLFRRLLLLTLIFIGLNLVRKGVF